MLQIESKYDSYRNHKYQLALDLFTNPINPVSDVSIKLSENQNNPKIGMFNIQARS